LTDIQLEAVLGMVTEGITENGEEGEFKYIVRSFVSAIMYLHPAQQYKKEIQTVRLRLRHSLLLL
jgi:hypothetical protein